MTLPSPTPAAACLAAAGALDGAVVVAYLIAVIALGLWVGRGQRTTTDFFLGGRTLPGWAILLSIVATETSTVTFLSIPGLAYRDGGDMTFLQITFGYMVGRVAAAVVLVPLYFRGETFTAYEVLQQRFGQASRRVASALFLLTRNASDSLRLYLTAIALREVLQIDFAACVLAVGGVTLAYTYFGGVKSVIWNDCLQFVVYMAGGAAALAVIISRMPGGWEQVWQFADDTGRLRVLNFDLRLATGGYTFWAGVIGGGFLTAATHGVDQLTVQRLLSARSQRSAQTALVASGIVVCGQFALFLMIGAALACFYGEFPPASGFDAGHQDRVFSHFIVNELPTGLTGLTLAAVFAAAMSTLSSSLNSSATALLNDLLPTTPSDATDERAQLRRGRLLTILFAVVQVAGALVAYYGGVTDSVVNSVLKIAGFAWGPLLGLYLLGVLAKHVEQREALLAFACGVVILATVATTTAVDWPWYAAIGAVVTFVTGLGLAPFAAAPAADE
ncbi:MAG: transporter [Planctomycetaceae bacterium]|nr:transporter [Planctomycetaceae bacterium]